MRGHLFELFALLELSALFKLVALFKFFVLFKLFESGEFLCPGFNNYIIENGFMLEIDAE